MTDLIDELQWRGLIQDSTGLEELRKHLTSGPAAHVLLLLVQPEARAITTDILRFGLGQISDTLPVYLLLREYQRELRECRREIARAQAQAYGYNYGNAYGNAYGYGQPTRYWDGYRWRYGY